MASNILIMGNQSLLWIALLLLASCGAPAPQDENLNVDSIHVEERGQDSLLFGDSQLRIFKIDSAAYFQVRRLPQHDTLPYVEDLAETKTLLKGRVIFGASVFQEGKSSVDSSVHGGALYSVRFANGDSLTFRDRPEFMEIGFVRYYPSEDILVFEGGHSSDYTIDLRRGLLGPEVVGNPSYINESPGRPFRLNGWFPGQECSSYFLQQRSRNGYQKYAELPLHLHTSDFALCTLVDIFWSSDSTLYFRNSYFDGFQDPRSGFFKLVILQQRDPD
ncbi:hypothetical protein [Sphingobacterium paludis]|uniref:DKNYY family protein n=1 Tax=Sphingobacterium paludis TaxID=1476465 RepID=A0A4R7D6S6_9SPHI|nr:hypothetical protein [Sphingobacterium paludis]TDS14676.1 hypothetical protein B0I21_103171 [Sphingobacterium paludis]